MFPGPNQVQLLVWMPAFFGPRGPGPCFLADRSCKAGDRPESANAWRRCSSARHSPSGGISPFSSIQRSARNFCSSACRSNSVLLTGPSDGRICSEDGLCETADWFSIRKDKALIESKAKATVDFGWFLTIPGWSVGVGCAVSMVMRRNQLIVFTALCLSCRHSLCMPSDGLLQENWKMVAANLGRLRKPP